jgi:HK97 family phage portal protein
VGAEGGWLMLVQEPSGQYHGWHRPGPVRSSSFPLAAHTGDVVTRRNALGISAFYACVALLARAGSSLPLRVRERQDHRQIISGADVAIRLRDRPNAHSSGVVFWGTVIQQLAAGGNAYAVKVPASDELVRAPELLLAHPDHSYPYHDENGEVHYALVAPNGHTVRLHGRHVIHWKGFGLDDTLVGHSPVSVQRHALGVALSAQEYQGKNLRNDATPGGVLSVDEDLSIEQVATIREQWHSVYGGAEGAGRIAVLDQGATFQPIAMTHHDAQFIEQRELSATEISAMFSIPPSMIGAKGAGFEYKNTNDRRMDFLTFALMPFLRMVEGPLGADPDYFGVASGWEPRFDTREFLRPDPATRYEMYAQGIASGFLDFDEARDGEGLPPRGGPVGEPGRASNE